VNTRSYSDFTTPKEPTTSINKIMKKCRKEREFEFESFQHKSYLDITLSKGFQ